jgi:hypothetical protein
VVTVFQGQVSSGQLTAVQSESAAPRRLGYARQAAQSPLNSLAIRDSMLDTPATQARNPGPQPRPVQISRTSCMSWINKTAEAKAPKLRVPIRVLLSFFDSEVD